MNIIILGSGTCVPSLARNAPGYYLKIPDRQVLVDCGSWTMLQLEKAGKSYKSIDAVFITHTHPDHVSDLMSFVHALSATPDFKKKKDLFIIGPSGVRRFYDSCIGSIMRRPKIFPISTLPHIMTQNG